MTRARANLKTLLTAGVGATVKMTVEDGKLARVQVCGQPPKHKFGPRGKVRCQYRSFKSYLKERDGGHDLVRMKFKCRWCKAWVCGECEGTHDPDDPVGNKLCDPCWARREARKKQNVKQRSWTLGGES